MASGSGTLARRASANQRENRARGSDDVELEDSCAGVADTRFEPAGAIEVAILEDPTILFATHAV